MKLPYATAADPGACSRRKLRPIHALLAEVDSVAGMPVIVAELHSMLAPFCLALKAKRAAPGLSDDTAALCRLFQQYCTGVKRTSDNMRHHRRARFWR